MRRAVFASSQSCRLSSRVITRQTLHHRAFPGKTCFTRVLHSRFLSGSTPTLSSSNQAPSEDSINGKSFSFGPDFLASLAELSNSTGVGNLPEVEVRKITENAKAIQIHLSKPADPISRIINIEFMAYMVAGYRALKENGLPLDQIRLLLENAILKFMEPMTAAVQADLDSHPDAFTRVVDGSKDKEEHFYIAPDFELERARDEPDAYHIKIRKCWYIDTLSKLGAREIGSSFCAFDRTWYDCIDPKRHGFKFTRPTTIAQGAESCSFNFDRIITQKAAKV